MTSTRPLGVCPAPSAHTSVQILREPMRAAQRLIAPVCQTGRRLSIVNSLLISFPRALAILPKHDKRRWAILPKRGFGGQLDRPRKERQPPRPPTPQTQDEPG